MTRHTVLNTRDDVDRVYASWEEGGRVLASIEDSVDASIQWFEDYNRKSRRGLLAATSNDTENTVTNRMTITRKQKREEKQFYGRFKWLINNISREKTWTGLRKWNLKRETEFLLIAAENNAIRSNSIKARIDKTQQNSKWRSCGDRDETINQIISQFSNLAQKKYKTRHKWVDRVIHWEMCKKFNFDHTNKWYMHKPAAAQEKTQINSYGTLTYKRIT